MTDNTTAHERRAHRLGIVGEAVRPFLAMNDTDQQIFLAAKWRLEGEPAYVAAQAAAHDMTPATYRARYMSHDGNLTHSG